MDAIDSHRTTPPTKGKLTRANLRRGLFMGRNILWQIGVEADDQAVFWRSACHSAKKGQIEPVTNMAFVRFHLIQFTREALRDEHNASFYAAKKAREGIGRGVGLQEAA